MRESSYPNRTVLTHCGGFASLLFALRTAAAMSTPSPCVSIFERAAFVSSFDRITSCCISYQYLASFLGSAAFPPGGGARGSGGGERARGTAAC